MLLAFDSVPLSHTNTPFQFLVYRIPTVTAVPIRYPIIPPITISMPLPSVPIANLYPQYRIDR